MKRRLANRRGFLHADLDEVHGCDGRDRQLTKREGGVVVARKGVRVVNMVNEVTRQVVLLQIEKEKAA